LINPELSIDSFKTSSARYDGDTYCLRSAVHHLGSTAYSGHYLCDSVRVDTEEHTEGWVRFDDGLVKEMSLSALIEYEKNRGDAYMLMYTL